MNGSQILAVLKTLPIIARKFARFSRDTLLVLVSLFALDVLKLIPVPVLYVSLGTETAATQDPGCSPRQDSGSPTRDVDS